jgi:hypothetical protein
VLTLPGRVSGDTRMGSNLVAGVGNTAIEDVTAIQAR